MDGINIISTDMQVQENKMKPEIETIQCEVCGHAVLDTKYVPCRFCNIHENTKKFLLDLQKAQEATRKSNTHFGPGPNGSYDCNIDNSDYMDHELSSEDIAIIFESTKHIVNDVVKK